MWLILLILGVILLVPLVSLIIYIQYWHNYWRYKDIPHDRPRPLLEIFKTLSKHGIKEQALGDSKYYTELYQKFKGSGPFCGFYHLLDTRILILDSGVMHQILVKNFSNFNERGCYYNISEDPLSADLLSFGGKTWQEMRLKLESLFHETELNSYQKVMQRESEKLVKMLNKQKEDLLIDMKTLLHHYALSTVASLVFGLEDEKWLQKYPLETFDHMTHLALHTRRHDPYLSALMQRYPNIFRRFGFATTPLNVQNYFHALLGEVISERETYSEVKEDLLQNLLSIVTQELHTHEMENLRDPRELKKHLLNELLAQAFTFVKAGLEPTEKTLTYILYELAKNLVLQQRVREEILKQRAANEDLCNYDFVQSLKLLKLIMKETVRLHPITPYLIRRTLSDYTVPNNPGYLIPKNTYVIIPVQAIHQDPCFYTQPKLFNPERFNVSADDIAGGSLLWFGCGMGPRNCVGWHFAQLQILTLLTFLLSEYEFSLDIHQQLNDGSLETLPLKIKSLKRRSEYVEYVDGVESLVE